MKLFPIIDINRSRDRITSAINSGLWCMVVGVPAEMIADHDPQCQRNHGGQTLEKMCRRGGLSAAEMLAILDDREYKFIEFPEAHAELHERITAWLNARKM